MNRRYLKLFLVLLLASGISLSTGVFSIIDKMFLRPLPYENPEELVVIDGAIRPFHGETGEYWSQPTTLTGAFGYSLHEILPDNRFELKNLCIASSNIFDVLGAQPVIGYGFSKNFGLNGANVVVLSNDAYRELYMGNNDIIGDTIILGGVPHVVTGVLGRDFTFIGNPYFYVPEYQSSSVDYGSYSNKGVGHLEQSSAIIGRIIKDTLLSTVHAELWKYYDALIDEMNIRYNNEDRSQRGVLSITPWSQYKAVRVEKTINILSSGAFVFLSAICFNITGFLLTDILSKFENFAIRRCLGAGFLNIFCLIFKRIIFIVVAGVVVGHVLSPLPGKTILFLFEDTLPDYGDIFLDAGSIVFSAALGSVISLLMALGISIFIFCHNPIAFISNEGGAVLTKKRGKYFLKVLVGFQIIFAVILLMSGTSIFIHSYKTVNRSFGYNTNGTAFIQLINPGSSKEYIDDCNRIYFMLEKGYLPFPVGFIGEIPLFGNKYSGYNFFNAGNQNRQAVRINVGGDYFRIMGTPMPAGKSFGEYDENELNTLVIISESVAVEIWGNANNAVNKKFQLDGETSFRTIAGVARDIVLSNNDQFNKKQFYVYKAMGNDRDEFPNILVNEKYKPEFYRFINEHSRINHNEPPVKEMRIEEIIAASNKPFRLALYISIGIASVSAIIVIISLCGFIGYKIQSQQRELSVRFALGAARSDIFFLIINDIWPAASVSSCIGFMWGYINRSALMNYANDIVILFTMLIIINCIVLFTSVFFAVSATGQRKWKQRILTPKRAEF